jgi:hypothetical protein
MLKLNTSQTHHKHVNKDFQEDRIRIQNYLSNQSNCIKNHVIISYNQKQAEQN